MNQTIPDWYVNVCRSLHHCVQYRFVGTPAVRFKRSWTVDSPRRLRCHLPNSVSKRSGFVWRKFVDVDRSLQTSSKPSASEVIEISCLFIVNHHITSYHIISHIYIHISHIHQAMSLKPISAICHLLQSVFSLCVTWCIWAIRCRPKLSKLPLRCDACDACAACAAEICGCDCF